ncbi:hypothetical protein EVA_16727 [gut metagenome]|uniref:Uncharacterized protein n=1 Tax=gut metagenome TaxID=749906 RepID=J9C5Q3_9ZZZZ
MRDRQGGLLFCGICFFRYERTKLYQMRTFIVCYGERYGLC